MKLICHLMHKNDKVCQIEFDELGTPVRIGNVWNQELLPPGGNTSAAALKLWWGRRAVPTSQAHVKRLLEQMGRTNQGFLLDNLGLSMTDHYWICPDGVPLRWEKVNFFDNGFEDLFAAQMFSGSSDPIELSGRVPGGSTQGDLIKRWVVRGGKRYLIKGNAGRSSQQSLNELLATEIHRRQEQQPYVEYHLLEYPSEGQLCCISEAFTSNQLEFIPALDVINSEKKRNDVSYYEHFIALCGKNGLEDEKVRSFLEYEIMTDFLISNTDRHFRNFGVLRDSDTLRYVAMAPVFDSGNSMFFDKNRIPRGEELYAVSINSFKSTELELLKYVTKKNRVCLELLPEQSFLANLYAKDPMPEARLAGLLRAYTEKEEILRKFSLGRKIVSPVHGYIRRPRSSS